MIHTVTIIGANGTMGRNVAAIFASFGNAKVYLVSRTLQKSIEAKEKAFLSVRAESIKEKMFPRDYSQLAECIGESELIFEACAEDWKVKENIHKQISGYLSRNQIVCSGTSGLSITALSEIYNEDQRLGFVGMHFFNPPYHMTLCELIPTPHTDMEIFKSLCTYAKNVLHRTVVEVKDTPAFLGNRIGFHFINEAMQTAETHRCDGGIDYIDEILGPFTGREMPPMITADFVGLDVHKAIVEHLYGNTCDYAHDTFLLPQFVNALIEEGHLGRKSDGGLYRNHTRGDGEKTRQVYDIEKGNYREIRRYAFPFAKEMVGAIRAGDYGYAFTSMISHRSKEARICCELLLKYILYGMKVVEIIRGGVFAMGTMSWQPALTGVLPWL